MKTLLAVLITVSLFLSGCPKKDMQKDDSKPPESTTTEPKKAPEKPAEVKSIDASTPDPEKAP